MSKYYRNALKRVDTSRQAKVTSQLLAKYRAEYPFRLVRDKQHSPKPHLVHEGGLLKDRFASVPTSGGVEWFFTTDEDRKRFMKLYGGTEL